MPPQHRLGNYGTKASRSCQSDHDDDQMKEKSDHIAHPRMLSKPTKHLMSASNCNSPWTGADPRGSRLFQAARARLLAGEHSLILVAVAMRDGAEQAIAIHIETR